jgi:hypothetical protein
MNSFNKYQKKAAKADHEPQKTESVIATNPKEVSNAPKTINTTPSTDTGKFLLEILHITPFFNYFEYVANKHYLGKCSVIKINKLKVVHPTFFKFSIISDNICRGIAMIMLFSLAAFSIYKILK